MERYFVLVCTKENTVKCFLNTGVVIPLDDGMSAVQFAFNNPVDVIYIELQALPITRHLPACA